MSDHEIRIALVLNGGVSLAVWMGGVTHELDLIRRASGPGDAPGPRPYDEILAERWRELCHRGNERRRVVVDVIAGTSAGGLNGSLLATAISNGSTLDPDGVNGPWLREKWIGLGSLEVGKLVPAAGVKSTSVLDGNYFLHELGNLLKDVADAGETAAEEPVTLFVTASGLGVQQFEAKDAAGQRFVVPDHRYLFAFTSEKTAKYDGTQFVDQETNGLADTGLLARAARASASYPAAFGPVLETPQLAAAPPRMRPNNNESGAWLVDGGVLDNAPFGPVLDVVARRPVAGRASRYVLYVVPSAGIGSAETALPEAKEPSWRVAALSAVQFPREVDFRSDVEQLERLLLEADASWSDTQRLFDRCIEQPVERERLRTAAKALQPAYARGRAAGGVWEAVTIASHDQSTVLDAASALSEVEIDEILATDHPWVPDPDGATDPLRKDADGNPLWLWGTGAAERIIRLILRSLRARIEVAPVEARPALEYRLKATSDCLLHVQAVRDALTDRLLTADLDLRPAGGAEAIAVGLTDIFEDLQIQAALGTAFADLIDGIGAELVDAALEVEIVSRCTSARTPQQRSAPFQFLRLGPDIPLTLLDDLPAGSIAEDLKDRILYGSQVGHFGAFGAAGWRRWDWLMGRLHCVAHLGAMLGADADWIRETQRQVLKAEDWKPAAVAERIQRLAEDFPAEAGLAALTTMRDELNQSPEGRATTKGLADRMVDVSGGLGPQVGTAIKAMAGRKEQPESWLLRTARWFTAPARETAWDRIVRGAKLTPAKRPLLFEPWLPLAGLGVGVLLLVVAALAGSVLFGVLAGVFLALGVVLAAVTMFVRRARQLIRGWIERRIPEISPASRNR
ncbi:DUF3376 domain-containing protein [Kribbella sandramycini]|uniref:DUF3376 domain-containing protein n=1 Tax=Kribbella sandramycini TaxID=60450 RepID=A0A7Y4KVI5_9ACTN|nr:DUF3376 domain-containing protein [Kribbella sandramycini]MBB6568066.1 putative acylesterase/phospholipase RssA [Kribbella sandramycini]NOL39340.1 DUF3376 domain-containing protein [Kribbella sandramycini]